MLRWIWIKYSVKANKIAQTRLMAFILTFCGGFIDAYTYMLRGHTLSAGQTGNIIFFATSLANGNLTGMINRGLTIIGFILGLILVTLLKRYAKNAYWRIFEMIPLIVVSIVLGFLPTSIPNYFIVPITAFGMAMQSGAFRKIEGLGYSNVFTSGNLRKTVLSWSSFYINGDESEKQPAQNYTLLVVAFTTGAVISALLQKMFQVRAIWIASCILVIVNLVYGLMIFRSVNDNGQN